MFCLYPFPPLFVLPVSRATEGAPSNSPRIKAERRLTQRGFGASFQGRKPASHAVFPVNTAPFDVEEWWISQASPDRSSCYQHLSRLFSPETKVESGSFHSTPQPE